jgi:hypothetical protein
LSREVGVVTVVGESVVVGVVEGSGVAVVRVVLVVEDSKTVEEVRVVPVVVEAEEEIVAEVRSPI